MSQIKDLNCPSNVNCINLHEPCISCNVTTACRYGSRLNATCRVYEQISCKVTENSRKMYIATGRVVTVGPQL
ncbi:unnamed protein product [Acanthoscelides obtectus]|uniref:Uncharacterized protein n=1 Tax=Acanthoscelides obtectus TaxID=200917 RepID=A0A9P0LET7_ACAOB|nr:unnamed protein product [Acanthoscelides obtectus]CAK1636500.1 hypothetical protein AOBTE_LOCUS9865 [Acanthoscelides obtectus]